MDPQTVATTWRLVLVCGTFLLCWLIAWITYFEWRKKQLQFEERRAAIEHGMAPPPPPPQTLSGWPGVRQHELELRFAERRLMIEKGMDVCGGAVGSKPPLTKEDYLRRGIMSACVGVGFLLAYGLLGMTPVGGGAEARAWCLGLGPLLTFFGIGNLIYRRYMTEAPPQGRQELPRSAG